MIKLDSQTMVVGTYDESKLWETTSINRSADWKISASARAKRDSRKTRMRFKMQPCGEYPDHKRAFTRIDYCPFN